MQEESTPNPDLLDMAPLVVGYEVLEKLGQGGMAEVWLAQREGSTLLVVIKRLLQRHAASQSTRMRILREAQVGALLAHPNIARTVDAGSVDGTVYIATEYVPGKDLEALSHTLARTRQVLPAGTVARVMVDVLEGLHAAHETRDAEGRLLGLVHRDLSPRNIQLRFDGAVKIIDFGLARAQIGGFHTEPGTVLGTYRYMSPEQAIGEPVDRRSDLFTLGTSMYELFTGRWLFDAPSKHDILRAIIESRLDAPSDVNPVLPRALDAVIQKAMAHHPSERFQSALDLRNALIDAIPDWCATPRTELADILQRTFPHDAQRDRERAVLARHRGPRAQGPQAEVTRDQSVHDGPVPRTETKTEEVAPAQLELGRSDSAKTRPGSSPSPLPRRVSAGPSRSESPANSRTRDQVHGAGTQVVRRRGPGKRGFRGRKRTVDPFDQRVLGHRYELIDQIGSGGMGKVYLAQRRGAGRLCVIKLMHRDLLEHGGARPPQRFEREAEILRRANHPAIPNLLDIEIRPGELAFMAMEYVAGPNLAQLADWAGGSLPPRILLPLAIELLGALHHLHELRNELGAPMGIVHRDISPSNLMVGVDGRAKLIDFGVVRRADERLTAVGGATIGKIPYFSPEQILSPDRIDLRADIYAFGVSLYELLTGHRRVSPNLSDRDAFEEVLHTPLPPIKDRGQGWAPLLTPVLEKAQAKKADLRFSTAETFRLELEARTRRLEKSSPEQVAEFIGVHIPDDFEELTVLPDWAVLEELPSVAVEPTHVGRTVHLERDEARSSPPRWGGVAMLLVGLGMGLAIGVMVMLSQSSLRTDSAEAFRAAPTIPRPDPGLPAAPGVAVEPKEVVRPVPAKAAPTAPKRPIRTRGNASSPPADRALPPPPPSAPDRIDRCEAGGSASEREASIQSLRTLALALDPEARLAFQSCVDSLELILETRPDDWERACRRCLKKAMRR